MVPEEKEESPKKKIHTIPLKNTFSNDLRAVFELICTNNVLIYSYQSLN